MNLAYLNLAIFGFMSLISKNAAYCLERIPEGVRENVKDTPWYKDAHVLSTLHTLDDIDFSFTIPAWVKFKSLVDGALFNVLFMYRIGKVGSILAAAYCCYLILAGVYQGVPGGDGYLCMAINWLGASFWLAAAAFTWPVLCVAAGAWVGWRAKRELRYHLKDLGTKEMKEAEAELGKVEAAVKQTA